MQEKRYRVRVEIATVVEFDVWAVHEDEAAAIAEQEATEHLPGDLRCWNCYTHEVEEVGEE